MNKDRTGWPRDESESKSKVAAVRREPVPDELGGKSPVVEIVAKVSESGVREFLWREC